MTAPETDSELRAAGQFLLDRLAEYEPEFHGHLSDYMGHVEPAVARFNAALARAPAPTMEADGLVGWEIDRTTDNPILMYEKCSVIQDDQALYVMSLLNAAASGANPAPAAPTLEALPKDTVRFKSLSTVDDETAPAPTLEADGLVERLQYAAVASGASEPKNTAEWEAAAAITQLRERLATVEREREALKQGEPDAAKALDALALRWAVKSWMTKDFPQQACEDFKHDVLATYVSLARPYLNRAEASEAKVLALGLALSGLVGLVQLVRSRDDCSVEIKQALTDNYRLDDAFAALEQVKPAYDHSQDLPFQERKL